jgi:hypothetical protein
MAVGQIFLIMREGATLMIISTPAKTFILVCALTLSFTGSAQDSMTSRSLHEQLIQLSRLTDKELMIRQNLANVPLSEAQLKIIDQHEPVENENGTGAVISSLGGGVSCYVETRFLLSKDVRYDETHNVLVGQFRPDNNSSNIICRDFSTNPETLHCSINSDGKTANITGDIIAQYYERCVDQINRILSTDS